MCACPLFNGKRQWRARLGKDLLADSFPRRRSAGSAPFSIGNMPGRGAHRRGFWECNRAVLC